jgi:integrative and conjugative element protein (TIGR02256 family)
LPPVISAGLYSSGKIGLLFIESMDNSCRLLHEWAFIYQQAIINKNIRDVLFNDKIENVNIGQSCSSQTMIASDAQISLIASSMSIRIQEIISNNFNVKAEINLYLYQEYGLNVKIVNIPEFLKLPSFYGWDIYISCEISNLMLKCLISKKPNETGGVLLGTVFEYAKTIVITSLLSAPSDSIEKRHMFVLGTIGLYKKIQNIETKTSGKVTYLGTWHTHPYGGEVSSIDKKTLEKLLSARNYEPTVCLIRTPSEIILV